MAVKATRKKIERRNVFALGVHSCRHRGDGIHEGLCGDSWKLVKFTRVLGTKRWKRGRATCYVGGHPQDKRGSKLVMSRTELLAKLSGGE